MGIWDKIIQKVGVFNVDPSDVQITICDTLMEDVTNFQMKATEKRRVETGIDDSYHTYVTIPHHYTINIDMLPESFGAYFLIELEKAIGTVGSYFEMVVKYNGRFVGIFDCYMTTEADEIYSRSINDTTFEIIAVRQTEQYMSFGEETPVAEDL